MRKVALILILPAKTVPSWPNSLWRKDMMYMAPFAAHLLISGNGSRIWKAIPLSIFTMRI